MDYNKVLEDLTIFFGEKMEITLDDLRRYFRKESPSLPDSTIRWRVHDLEKALVLHRKGRSLFELGTASPYHPEISPRAHKVSKFIQKSFPGTLFCSWNSDLLNEFAQHISAYPFILADVERDVAESVYYSLKEEFNGVFFRPNESLINNVLPDFRLPIIVRYLTSESPLGEYKRLPMISIEKILADIFCDIEFNFLIGSERREIFRNAYYKYTVNENRLLRYAARKGRRDDLQRYVRDGGFSEIRK